MQGSQLPQQEPQPQTVSLPQELLDKPLNLVQFAADFGWVTPSRSLAASPVIGKQFLPPMNAQSEVVVPVRPLGDTERQMAQIGLQSVSDVPVEFSWRSVADIAKYKGWTVTESPLSPVQNQYTCGSCWAWSSATMLSDRYAIYTGQPNPGLGPSYLLACLPKSQKCSGGFPSAAGKFFETQGTPTAACWDYSWCNSSANCRHGGGLNLSDLVPSCQSRCVNQCETETIAGTPTSTTPTSATRCKHGGSFDLYKAKPGSTQALVTPHSIRVDLLLNGPVVAVYRVFGDFVAGTMPQADGWKLTKGVYVKIPNKDIYHYGTLNCQGVRTSPVACYLGNHAVVIVGWGVERDVPNFLDPAGPPLDLPYWVVRNSWGSEWNGDGYFKMAVTNESLGINVLCGLDIPIRTGGRLFGGATTWEPNVPFGRQQQQVHRGVRLLPSLSTSSMFSSPVFQAAALTLVFVALLAVVFYVSRKNALTAPTGQQ